MNATDRQKLEWRCKELQRIAKERECESKFLGSDLDEALLSAMEFYLHHPDSPKRTEGVFRMCLRRELARRLRFGSNQKDRRS